MNKRKIEHGTILPSLTTVPFYLRENLRHQNYSCQNYVYRLRFFLVRDRPKELAFDGNPNPFPQNISQD
jgi:hypothetical protein